MTKNSAHISIKEFFDDDYYSTHYPDVSETGLSGLDHYLTTGWQEGRNPSANFNTAFYRKYFQEQSQNDLCPLLHWTLYGRHASLPTSHPELVARRSDISNNPRSSADLARPGNLDKAVARILMQPYFDTAFYLTEHPDVASDGMDAWVHFQDYGYKERRKPNPTFDCAYYEAQINADIDTASLNLLLHYATIGRLLQTPTSAESELAHKQSSADLALSSTLTEILSRLGYQLDGNFLNNGKLKRKILPIFSAQAYRKNHNLKPEDVSDADALFRYLALDLPAGKSPSALFSEQFYTASINSQGHRPNFEETPALHHWLSQPWHQNVSPIAGFDPEDYLELNPDLQNGTADALDHFLNHGQFEGRRFSKIATVESSRAPTPAGESFSAPLRFLERVNSNPDAVKELYQMRGFLASPELTDLVAQANNIDPNIGMLDNTLSSFLPPWHDSSWSHFENILHSTPSDTFDSVVLMPFCKLGGSDFVAGILTTSLAKQENVLVIRTETSDWERPDWFPTNITTLDLSKQFQAMEKHERERALYTLLMWIRPAQIFNVNSRLGFDVLVRFGERLAVYIRLFAYYFCADRTKEGREVGYPVWYFANILPHLSAALCDNQALVDQLAQRYCLSGRHLTKVKCIYTPATALPDGELINSRPRQPNSRTRKRIYWAGRLDAQKRFDLVIEIAQLLPELDFECWGKAVLDAPPDLSRLPANIHVHTPFHAYQDLDLEAADGWLYTSAWDGIPTLLIELGSRAMPIVASAVGGVGELINADTGWPIAESGLAADYAAAISQMIAQPEEAFTRGKALQALTQKQHNHENYEHQLNLICGTTDAERK
ncbi:MAG: glycosyltransferase family 4 protein [Gammaproteobacteria bacterium]|nr:glycosyltransferase family 4 protein [Gammaproteobacteria bacterium]